MKNQGTAKLLSLLLVTQFAFMPITKAADSDATQAALIAAVLAPPKCEDWSKAVSFEEATQEYMRQALITPRDFSCVSRASWMAVEDLFRPENSSIYLSRLKDFDKTYTSKTYKTEAAQKAVEDIKILFQLRWLSNNYEAMKDYRSSKVVKSVVVGTVAAGVIVGAGFLLHIHSQALYEVEAALWPAAIRMLGYIGTMLFTRVATNESTGEGSGKLKMTRPPLDIIGGRGEMFWSYGDLHLMRDMTALTANAVASGLVHAGTVAISVRYIGGLVRLLSAGSIVGFAVAYPIGLGVEWAVDKAITDKYHKLHADRTSRMTAKMKSANRTDWELNVLATEMTNSSITWAATQDMSLQNKIENMVYGFAERQVCLRIAKPWLKVEFAKEERELRTKVYFEIEKKRTRLLEVRDGILKRMISLEKVQKSFISSFVVQHRALIDRLDRYLNHDLFIDERLELLHQQVETLSQKSKLWEDVDHLNGLRIQNSCM